MNFKDTFCLFSLTTCIVNNMTYKITLKCQKIFMLLLNFQLYNRNKTSVFVHLNEKQFTICTIQDFDVNFK